MSRLARLLPDRFTLYLICTVIIASIVPAHGKGVVVFGWITNIAVGLLFFLHGARLSREAIIAGLTHWKLHLTIFSATFLMFPLLGLALKPVLEPLVTPELYLGILFLCCLPATVQSAIAFTSMARGNVPAAVCSASLSSILGVFLTPLLLTALAGTSGGVHDPLHAIGGIMLQLLVPFVAGHLLRPWIAGWVEKQRALLRYTDQATILLVVYSAFGEAVTEGLWSKTPLLSLFAVAIVAAVLLGIAMPLITFIARRLRFNREDEIAIVFCGSKKSLATGVPIAKVLFAGGSLGAIVLPVMIYHQIQLIVCGVIAQRYARRKP